MKSDERLACVIRVVGQTLGQAADKALPAAMEKVVQAAVPSASMAAIALPAFAGALVQSLLAVLLQARDVTAELTALVKEIRNGPLRTGLEQLRVAEALGAGSEQDRKYRDDRLRDALRSLDSASQLSPTQRPLVDYLRGLCALQLPGGGHEAALHLGAFQDSCRTAAGVAADIAARLASRADAVLAEASAIPQERSRGIGGSFIGWSEAQGELRRRQLLSEASSIRGEAETQRLRAQELAHVAEAVSLLLRDAGLAAVVDGGVPEGH